MLNVIFNVFFSCAAWHVAIHVIGFTVFHNIYVLDKRSARLSSYCRNGTETLDGLFNKTYLCQRTFSTLLISKNKYGKKLNVESDLRLQLLCFNPDFFSLVRGTNNVKNPNWVLWLWPLVFDFSYSCHHYFNTIKFISL